MSTVKVKALRTFEHGAIYVKKDATASIPADLAKELAKGPRPAVELIKEKA